MLPEKSGVLLEDATQRTKQPALGAFNDNYARLAYHFACHIPHFLQRDLDGIYPSILLGKPSHFSTN